MAKIQTISIITDEDYNLQNMTTIFDDSSSEILLFTYNEDKNISEINGATVTWGVNSE